MHMSYVNFSCRDCTERHEGCHGTCEAYLKEKATQDKIRKKIFSDKKTSYEVENTNYTMYDRRRDR